METVAEFSARRRKIIGLNIKLGRGLANNITGDQLTEMLDIGRTQLSDWETGRHEPSRKNLDRVAAALGQPREFFLTERTDEEIEAMLAAAPPRKRANG